MENLDNPEGNMNPLRFLARLELHEQKVKVVEHLQLKPKEAIDFWLSGNVTKNSVCKQEVQNNKIFILCREWSVTEQKQWDRYAVETYSKLVNNLSRNQKSTEGLLSV